MSSYQITLSGPTVPAGRVHAVVGEVMLQASAPSWRVEGDERAGVATRARPVAASDPWRAEKVLAAEHVSS